ncbi:MAG TPA: hypothetical protein VGO98_02365 [Candidatus Saccharimonadales bacterium]|nr:hypothetical protein [Candidatus Saccharimonadales bacterium]
MGLFIRQDDTRSELQRRLAAELTEKARKRAEIENTPPDGVDDSAYIKDTQGTSKHAWIWILLVVVGVVVVIVSMFR